MKIIFKSSNILESNAGLIVNPVNTVGVMGAGLAKNLKQQYPDMFKEYRNYCKDHKTVRTFKGMYSEEDSKVIYCLPTKEDYQHNSELWYVRYGMVHFVNFLNNYPHRERLERIAIPALGCGLGGLDLTQVLHVILYQLRNLEFECTVELYGFGKIPKGTREIMGKRYLLKPDIPKRFTGVGSRETPDDTSDDIVDVCRFLMRREYLMATGDAIGADQMFFETYPLGYKERYAPLGRRYYKQDSIIVPSDEQGYKLAESIAGKCHPAWKWMKERSYKELHIRNVFQVLGRDLSTPSEFLVVWTPDGAELLTGKKTGGTGQAIRIAKMFGIPVFNLYNSDALQRLSTFLGFEDNCFKRGN